MDLRRYQDCKYALAAILRGLPWRPETALRNRRLFERLAMDRFNVAVVGRYSRGKSTLLNAMTGSDRLPTGDEPLTSVITSVAYGSEEKVVLHFRNTSLTEEVPFARLADYVTEHGNPGNARRVEEAEILLPAAILRSGFRFVDTPGLGSIVRANTETTMDFLAQIDAFVLVSGFDAPLSPEEEALLGDIARTRKPLFAVLNKADVASSAEPVEARFREALAASGFGADPPVFRLSARRALAARLAGDEQGLRRSGLPEFEAALADFLLRERRGAFLRGMVDRVAEAVAEDAPEDASALLRRTEDLRREIAADSAPETAFHADGGADSVIPPCSVCASVEEAVFRLLTRLQHALRGSEEARRRFLDDGGLCADHSRAFGRIAAPREICTAYAPLLLAEARRLRESAETGVSGTGIVETGAVGTGTPRCSACAVAVRTAAEGVHALAGAAGRDGTHAAGLCRPHFGQLLACVGVEERGALLKRQADILERRADDMARFALKQDAARRDAMTTAEVAAPRAGLDQWAGLADAWRGAQGEP